MPRLLRGRSTRFLAVCSVAFGAVLLPSVAAAESDVTGPQLVSLDFAPQAVDNSAGPVTFGVTARITDDVSGFVSGGFCFTAPSGVQSACGQLGAPTRVSGDAFDGVYETTATVLQFGETGTWHLQYVYGYDLAHNQGYFPEPVLISMGIPTELVVTGISDVTGPQLVSLDFAPKAVDNSAGPVTFGVTARIADDVSGFDYGGFCFIAPSGVQSACGQLGAPTRVSGDAFDGVYETTATVLQFAETGTWHLMYLYGYDLAHNQGNYDEAALISLGFPTELVVGVGDTTPPTVAIVTPVDGASYPLGSTVLADYACIDEDGGSGPATCAGDAANGAPIDTATVGGKSLTVTATDNAGNSTSTTHEYTVVYPFSGFYSPVDSPPVFNRLRAGAAVPVRFSLDGYHGLGVFAEGYPVSQPISCDAAVAYDDVETTVAAGSSALSYDATSDQYVYVWKTAKSWTGCRKLVVQLDDGAAYTAYFKFG